MMRILHMALLVLGLLPLTLRAETLRISHVALMSINSAITPATYDYLKDGVSTLTDSTLLVVRINTPGGLVSTTKEIITLFGKLQRPVVVWITPEGASASSAGAIIASSAHFIFMSPGTNMGAATPVGLGEDIKESDGRKKAVSDLTAMVRSLSEQRGRPPGPFEEMITTAKSFTDREALKLGMITGVVSDLSSLLKELQGREMTLLGKVVTLEVDEAALPRELEPTLGQRLLDVLANPSTAYFLFLLGVALIYFEFQAPGGYIAGAAGVSFLILAAIAFQVLPLNWGALGLLIVGVIFFIMEVYITSYGVLSVAGLIAFVLGSLFLFKGETGLIKVEYPVIFSTLAGVFSSVAFLVWYLVRDQRRQAPSKNFFLPAGERGSVVSTDNKFVMVKVRGEIWKGLAESPVVVGDHIEIITVDQDKLLVHIKKVL